MSFARPPAPRSPRKTPKVRAIQPLGLNNPVADYGGVMPVSVGNVGLPGTLIWKSDVRPGEGDGTGEPTFADQEYVIVTMTKEDPTDFTASCVGFHDPTNPPPPDNFWNVGTTVFSNGTVEGNPPDASSFGGNVLFEGAEGATHTWLIDLNGCWAVQYAAEGFTSTLAFSFGYRPAEGTTDDNVTLTVTRYTGGTLDPDDWTVTGGTSVSDVYTSDEPGNQGSFHVFFPMGDFEIEPEGAVVDLAVSFGENADPVPANAEIGKIYANGRKIWEGGAAYNFDTLVGAMQVTTYSGTEDQEPDPTIAAVEGLSRTPAYRGQRYFVVSDFPLTEFDLTIPAFSVELEGDGSALGGDVITAPTTTLITWIEQVARWAKLDPDTDLTIDPAIDRTITGGALTEDITFGDFLARMGRAFGFTFTEADTIRITKRVVASSYTVDYAVTASDLADQRDAGLTTTRPTDATPLELRFDYYDPKARPQYRDPSTGDAIAQRFGVNNRSARRILWPVRATADVRKDAVKVPVVMTAALASGLARLALIRESTEKIVHASRQSPKFLFAEVGDVVTLPDGNDTHDAMIDEVEIGPDFAVHLRAVNLMTDEDLGETAFTAPVNLVAPVIVGIPMVGNTLTGSRGTWNGYPLPTFTYQWEWADTNTPISGATGLTYTIQASDLGHTLALIVTATNSVGSASAESAPTAPVSATNTAPTEITLSATTISETAVIGAVVAIISGYDPDGDSLTFSEVSDPDGKFTIVGNELRLSAALVFATDSSHPVTIRATDPLGNTYDKAFLITVLDETVPTITSSATVSVDENTTLAHSLTADESVTWTIHGGDDAGNFEISGSTLRWVGNTVRLYDEPMDSGFDNEYEVTVRATDPEGNLTDQDILVTVVDVGELVITWNAADCAPALVLSNGDLTVTHPGPTGNAKVRATTSKSTGKWVVEIGVIVDLSGQTGIGLASASTSLTGSSNLGSSGQDSTSVSTSGGVRVSPAGQVIANNIPLNYGPGETVMIAVDLDASLVWFRTSGSNWNNSGTANPATGVGGVDISAISGTLYPSVQLRGSGDQMTANFGASAFVHTIPSGFTSWDGSQIG